MGLFSRKRHTRDEYDSLSENLKDSLHYYRWMGSGHSQASYNLELNHIRDVKNKLEELYNQGHKEALKLNKKYDALVARVAKDAKALHGFEERELGIRPKSNEAKKHVGTVAGVISVAGFIFASLVSTTMSGNVVGSEGSLTPNFIFLMVGLLSGIVWMILREN